MIFHESKIKIDRYHRTRTKIIRELQHDSNIRILYSDSLLSADLTPINLTATVQDSTTVLLDWDDLAAEYDSLNTSFRVYVKNTVSGEIEQQIDGIQLSEAEVMGLTELEQYEFWVFTMVGDYESAESDHVFATPESQQPDAPQNFTVTVVQPDPTEGLVRMIFAKSGDGNTIYETPVDSYNSTVFESTGISDNIEDIKVDSSNRWVVIAGNDWPDIEQTDLDNPTGFSTAGGGGTWNAGVDVDEVNGHKYICDTYETIWVIDYNNNIVYELNIFSSRQGRPVRIGIDVAEDIMIIDLTSESNRLVSVPISSPLNNATEIESANGTHCFDVDLQRHVLFYRDLDDTSIIRKCEYDGTNNNVFYQHDEVIRWINWNTGAPNWIHFSTGSGLYGLNIDTKTVIQMFETPEIVEFDFEYEV